MGFLEEGSQIKLNSTIMYIKEGKAIELNNNIELVHKIETLKFLGVLLKSMF